MSSAGSYQDRMEQKIDLRFKSGNQRWSQGPPLKIHLGFKSSSPHLISKEGSPLDPGWLLGMGFLSKVSLGLGRGGAWIWRSHLHCLPLPYDLAIVNSAFPNRLQQYYQYPSRTLVSVAGSFCPSSAIDKQVKAFTDAQSSTRFHTAL